MLSSSQSINDPKASAQIISTIRETESRPETPNVRYGDFICRRIDGNTPDACPGSGAVAHRALLISYRGCIWCHICFDTEPAYDAQLSAGWWPIAEWPLVRTRIRHLVPTTFSAWHISPVYPGRLPYPSCGQNRVVHRSQYRIIRMTITEMPLMQGRVDGFFIDE